MRRNMIIRIHIRMRLRLMNSIRIAHVIAYVADDVIAAQVVSKILMVVIAVTTSTTTTTRGGH